MTSMSSGTRTLNSVVTRVITLAKSIPAVAYFCQGKIDTCHLPGKNSSRTQYLRANRTRRTREDRWECSSKERAMREKDDHPTPAVRTTYTSADVARKAGVSRTTIYYVINGKPVRRRIE